MMKYLFTLLCSLAAVFAIAQKTAYIPLYLQDANTVDGAQFTWSKTSQSANFTVIWGNTVGTNPANYPDPDLAFNPTAILDTLETIYAIFKTFGFVDESAGTNLSLYKIPVVMYNTWGAGAQGFANGGSADGVVGAFWAHPIAMKNGHVAAHELTHSLQAQIDIDYRADHNLGPVWSNAGIFWESHANFMRNLIYPQDVSAWGMDLYHIETWGDWKNTYENYQLLMAIMASDSIEIINRMWRESYNWEYPLQAYKRLSGLNQFALNQKMFEYVRRMATFDFPYNNLGKFFRQYRQSDLINYLPTVQAAYTVLEQVPGATDQFRSPIHLAPEEFAYNIIPLHPDPDSCGVIVKFKGHSKTNPHTGWRYGFVAAKANGLVSRYSDIYYTDTNEIGFTLEPGETKLYLVVMGAPNDDITTNTTNDTWHGYPKHFRYPYELTIKGARPEGFQQPSAFRSQIKSGAGHFHSNGGGWVRNTATVSSSVYVGPYATVLGNANISGNVRIENTAVVSDANVSGNAVIKNNAFVVGGTIKDNAVVQGQAFVENAQLSGSALVGMRAKVSNYQLAGTVEVGGDVIVYNNSGFCDNGVHYRLTNYYDDKLLECDGRTADHPVNKDVNNPTGTFPAAQMNVYCNCGNYPDCLTTIVRDLPGQSPQIGIFPDPVSGTATFRCDPSVATGAMLEVFDLTGSFILSRAIPADGLLEIDFSALPSGIYFAKKAGGAAVKFVVQH